MTWPGIFNQVIRDPKDVDDCWTMALLWAAVAADPGARRYTISEIRAAAGDPDDGVADGGNLAEFVRAATTLWPALAPTRYLGPADGLLEAVRSGRAAAVAVWAGALPRELQFRFTGPHAVGLVWDAGRGTFLLANPLAPEGSPPLPIAESALVAALTDGRLVTGGRAWGVTFALQEADMATIAWKEELWDAPAGLPFYDRPNGRELGRLSKAATIRTFGAPLSPSGTEDWAWRAGLVQTAQVTGTLRQLVVWFPRGPLTNARPAPSVDCNDLVQRARAAALERARTAALDAVGRAIDALAKEG